VQPRQPRPGEPGTPGGPPGIPGQPVIANNPDPKNTYPIPVNQKPKGKIQTGAEQVEKYMPYLKGKRIGMVVNPTSVIGGIMSVDYLHNKKVNIVKVFGPEHGFRGNASAGAKVDDAVDQKTGIPVISLYGTHFKPTKEDLSGIDLMIFDIQDVGARFYTYISTLHYVMEACAENNLELMILDRPNPNGFYVDGPVMEDKLKSFVGMDPVPIVHGMTVAEYAQMTNGEGWLANKVQCKLKIIKVANYTHTTSYNLPVKPSPNLNTQQSVLLYPSLCLFEGTIISVGRGTYYPFQVLGSPDLAGKYKFSFKPVSIPGMSETPLHKDKICYGIDLRKYIPKQLLTTGSQILAAGGQEIMNKSTVKQSVTQLNLKWLIELYKAYPDKSKFFDQKQSNQIGNFDRLAGTEKLKQQIIDGKSEEEIRLSWEPALSQYKVMRKKYLLYQ
jgi:uncharacterized protein YbbC (DUF1343 family)